MNRIRTSAKSQNRCLQQHNLKRSWCYVHPQSKSLQPRTRIPHTLPASCNGLHIFSARHTPVRLFSTQISYSGASSSLNTLIEPKISRPLFCTQKRTTNDRCFTFASQGRFVEPTSKIGIGMTTSRTPLNLRSLSSKTSATASKKIGKIPKGITTGREPTASRLSPSTKTTTKPNLITSLKTTNTVLKITNNTATNKTAGTLPNTVPKQARTTTRSPSTNTRPSSITGSKISAIPSKLSSIPSLTTASALPARKTATEELQKLVLGKGLRVAFRATPLADTKASTESGIPEIPLQAEDFLLWNRAMEEPTKIFFFMLTKERVAFQVHLKGAYSANSYHVNAKGREDSIAGSTIKNRNHWWRKVSEEVFERIPGAMLLVKDLNEASSGAKNQDQMDQEEDEESKGADFGAINMYIWTFPKEHYSLVVSRLEKYSQLRVDELPRSVHDTLVQQNETSKLLQRIHLTEDQLEQGHLGSIPHELWDFLLPFQRRGVAEAIARDGRVLIGDEMGLGKTVQALAAAIYYRSDWPMLLIVPSSLRFQWAEQIRAWLPDLNPEDVNVVLTSKGCSLEHLINIISYDLAVKIRDQLTDYHFDTIIADESHYLKNQNSLRAKIILPKLKQAKRIFLLSGTPATTSPKDLFTQVNAIRPRSFPSFITFGLRYCNAKLGPFGYNFAGSSNQAELNMLLERTVMFRRTKKDVLTELPPKTRQKVELVIQNSKHRKLIAEIYTELAAARRLMEKKRVGGESLREVSSQVKSLMTQLFKATGTAKLPFVIEYLKELFECYEDKILLFAHHSDVMDGLSHFLTHANIPFIRIDGSTSPTTRHTLLSNFTSGSEIRVALLSITAASVGLNLSCAQLVVFAELFWTPGVLLQAEDRAHRMGVRSAVDVRYLVAREGADEALWKMLTLKAEVLGEVLDGARRKQRGEESVAGGKGRSGVAAWDEEVNVGEVQVEVRDETVDVLLDGVLSKLDALEMSAEDDKRKRTRKSKKEEENSF